MDKPAPGILHPRHGGHHGQSYRPGQDHQQLGHLKPGHRRRHQCHGEQQCIDDYQHRLSPAEPEQALVATTPVTSDSVANAPTSISIAGTPTTGAASSSTIGNLTLGGAGGSVTDVLNGTFKIGTTTITLGGTGTTDTLQDLAKTIDENNYGVTATYSQTNKDIVFTSSNSALGAAGALVYTAAAGNGDQTTPTGTVSYSNANPVTTAEDYYSIGISSALGITDQATLVGPTYGGTANTGMTTDTSTMGGLATMSYTDAAGESLNGTDLINQTTRRQR